MTNRLQLAARIMDSRMQPSIFVVITIIVNSIRLSLAVFGFFTYDQEALLCIPDPIKEISSNWTPPHISVHASESVFNVRLNNNVIYPPVRGFFMLAEGTEADVELIHVSVNTTISVRCQSKGSYSKASSNILKSSVSWENATRYVKYLSAWHPYKQTFLSISIPQQDIQSGHFTCRSKDYRGQAETIRIFKQTAPNFDMSPFVSVRESTTQSDDTGHGFIVPCRTNYILETAPDLLWRKHEQDDFSMVTAEEMKSFRWDPRVGFKFNNSGRMWEMETLACQLGHHQKVFLPAPSGFMSLYVITVHENEIDCELAQRNHSNNYLRRSELNLIEIRFHTCFTDVRCDLDWELVNKVQETSKGFINPVLDNVEKYFQGVLERRPRSSKLDLMQSTVSQIRYCGILSCSFEHIYNKNRVPEISYTKFFEGLDSKFYLLPGLYPNSSVVHITQVVRPFYKRREEEQFHEFTCTIIDFVKVQRSIEFILRFKDNTEIVSVQKLTFQSGKASSIAKLNTMLHSNLTHVICRALTNEGKYVSAESPLQIFDASAPVIDNVDSYMMNFKAGDMSDNHSLLCPITGAPPPKYRWVFDEKNTKLVTGINTRYLKFRQIHEDLAGRYICQAWNDHGNSSFEFQVSVQPQDFLSTLSRTTILWTGFGTIVGLIGLGSTIVFVFKYLRAKRQTRNLTTEEALEFLNGIPISVAHAHSQQVDGSELALRLPFTKRLDPNVLIVARDSILGKGQYGIVYRGFLHAEAVAVKAFKRAVTYDEFRAALVEVKLMGFVGEHLNIIRFIGADVTNIERRNILIVMELSPFGSLEKHLRMQKTSTTSTYANTTSLCLTADQRLMRQKLFGFCEQIACAMEHLGSKNVIHGDLAARNVLVFNHDVVKVTDFGYSRQLYENNVYKPRKNRALPWRSASIELLRQMEFSTESDIWAFGVTVWEIFTFGNVPFASLRYSEQFVKSLEEGLRLEKPAGLCESQYAFLMECWNVEKSGRPTFTVLKSFFSPGKF